MAKYKYVGDGKYIDGLPTADLDDAQLNDEQKTLLKTGVSLGLYTKDNSYGKATSEAKSSTG